MLRFSVVQEIEELLRLQPQWDALWRMTPRASYFETAAFAVHSWRAVAEPEGAKLYCLTGSSGGMLRLIWPLKLYRRGLWQVLGPLCLNSTEYCNIVAAQCPEAAENVGAAIKYLAAAGKADVLNVPLSADANLHSAMTTWRGLKLTKSHKNFECCWRDGEKWEDFLATRGAGLRRTLMKARRRLSALGGGEFSVCESPEDRSEAIETMLRHKRQWLPRSGALGAWVSSDRFEALLKSASREPIRDVGGLVVFKWSVGREVKAVLVAAIGRRRADFLIAGYSPDCAKHSPGAQLLFECLKWAHANGLDVTFGPGEEDYKRYWSRGEFDTFSYMMPLSPWGHGAIGVAMARQARLAATRPRLASTVSKPV